MSRDGLRRPAVTDLALFGTHGCHLCEEAETVLAAATRGTVAWQVIDIADDAALLARYGERIPVLRRAASGAELNWPFDSSAVRRLLQIDSV